MAYIDCDICLRLMLLTFPHLLLPLQPLVSQSQGFEFMDEGGVFPSGLVYHKFGYIAKESGAQLRLKLDASITNTATNGGKVRTLRCPIIMHDICVERGVKHMTCNKSVWHLTNQVHVLISHLKSYVGMGTAIVSCTSGCSCDPLTINATLGFNASLTSFAHLEVTPSPECELQVWKR